MKHLLLLATSVALIVTTPLFAAGDAAKGEKEFKNCKVCHTIKNGDEVLFKGGKAGPNLYGVVGRVAGSEDYKYSKSLATAGQAGLIWTEESIALFITDPKAFLRDILDDSSAKSKMSFKSRKNQEDIAAFLATFSPETAESDDTSATSTENNDS